MNTLSNKTAFVFHVNLSPQYGDTSYLRTNPLLKEPLPQQGHRIDADEVVSLAVTHARMLLQTVLDAKTKTKPTIYVMPLSITAYYTDGREASRSEQLTSNYPDQVLGLVEKWYQKNLKELIDIGTDDI